MIVERSRAPRVSVCIPVYQSQFLHLALSSVLGQTFADFEILVGDDGDGELKEVVEAFADERIRYQRNTDRLGYAGNHCSLIARSSGDFVAFLQHDDVWHPTFLERTLAVFQDHVDVGLVVVGSSDIDEQGRTIAQRPTRMKPGIQDDPMQELLSGSSMIFLPSATIARATALAEVMKPWPDVNIADIAMYIDVALSRWRINYLGDILLGYRMHPQQLSAQELAHRSSVVDFWSSYSFSSDSHETMRRSLLSRAHMARAGILLKGGQSGSAKQDLWCAAKNLRPRVYARWLILSALSFAPALVPRAVRLWNCLHDPVKSRFKGI